MFQFERSIELIADENGQLNISNKRERKRARVHPVKHIPPALFSELSEGLNSDEEAILKVLTTSEEDKLFDQDNDTVFSFVFNAVKTMVQNEKQICAPTDEDNNEIKIIKYLLGPPFNALISLSVDSNIFEFWEDFSASTFEKIVPGMRAIKAKNEKDETDGFGIALDYRFVVSGPRDNVSNIARGYSSCTDIVRETIKVMTIDCETERTTVPWYELDHYLVFEVQLSPLDRIQKSTIKSKKLKSGALLKSRKKIKNKDHIVYIVRDDEEKVVYIGEGADGREKHATSGKSHNYELNKDHFNNKELHAHIYSTNLTKSEAKAIEFLLLKRYARLGLYNIKDYEK